ncbi:MAG: hypothetical protein WC508_02375 [Patescibacteria group bacterium]
MAITLGNKQLSNLFYFVVAYILILIGYAANRGLFFSQTQVWFLILAWLFLVLPFFKKQLLTFRLNLDLLNLLLLVVGFTFCLSLFFDEAMYFSSRQAFSNVFLLKSLALILFLFYFIDFKFLSKNFFSLVLLHLWKNKFIYLLIIAFLLRLLIIFYSPAPQIDVFWFLDGGAKALVAGHNPYSEVFFNPYTADQGKQLYGDANFQNDNYSYLPTTIFLTTISKLFFGDVRFIYLFAVFGTAAIIYFLVRRKFGQPAEIAELLSLLILYAPLSLFVLEQAWSEPLSIFLLALFVLAVSLNWRYLPYLIFGSFLGVKQVSLVFLAFLCRFEFINPKKYLLSIVTMLAIILPFLAWDCRNFINDTIVHHVLFQPPLHSLTLNTLSRILFYQDIPAVIYLPLLLGLFLFLFFKTKRDLSGIIHSSLVFLFALFLIKQGFANYYYSIIGGLIILMALELGQPDLNYENQK